MWTNSHTCCSVSSLFFCAFLFCTLYLYACRKSVACTLKSGFTNAENIQANLTKAMETLQKAALEKNGDERKKQVFYNYKKTAHFRSERRTAWASLLDLKWFDLVHLNPIIWSHLYTIKKRCTKISKNFNSFFPHKQQIFISKCRKFMRKCKFV